MFIYDGFNRFNNTHFRINVFVKKIVEMPLKQKVKEVVTEVNQNEFLPYKTSQFAQPF